MYLLNGTQSIATDSIFRFKVKNSEYCDESTVQAFSDLKTKCPPLESGAFMRVLKSLPTSSSSGDSIGSAMDEGGCCSLPFFLVFCILRNSPLVRSRAHLRLDIKIHICIAKQYTIDRSIFNFR